MLAETSHNEMEIEQLLTAAAFPHAVDNLQLLETHISWVILAGEFAYKLKKPVKFDFVDYSTLPLRRKFCELEVELNRRFAPNLYLGVVPIFEFEGRLQIGEEQRRPELATLEPLEYAVKMRQFPQEAILASRLQNQSLTAEVVEDFGRYIARFHDAIECAIPTMGCVQPDYIRKDALDNFELLQQTFENDPRITILRKLERWSVEQLQLLTRKFEQRLKSGFVRRCHGDLHLKNIVQVNGELHAFDGIEFNEELQWIDVLSEIAFPVMDLMARGRADLGWRLLNSYLEATGDYESLDVLKFYLVYRALVRAKVTWLNPAYQTPEIRAESSVGDPDFDQRAGPWDKYLDTANYFAFELEPTLAITHGFSGSGKSTLAINAIEQHGGIRLRSDRERHRLAGKFTVADKYSTDMNDWVYSYLLAVADGVIKAGFPVIVDATFLLLEFRQPFQALAEKLNVDFGIIACEASYEELCQRLQERGPDPSDATPDILKKQMETHDPLATDELQFVLKTLSADH